jgi:hypothetical protein
MVAVREALRLRLTPHTHDYLSGPAIQETVEAAVDRPDLWEACAPGMLCGPGARQDACMEGSLRLREPSVGCHGKDHHDAKSPYYKSIESRPFSQGYTARLSHRYTGSQLGLDADASA